MSEIFDPGNRGFYTSFQSASQQVAILVASSFGYLLSEVEVMPAATVAEWGWRIPFFIVCLIIPSFSCCGERGEPRRSSP